jgi:putative ABC transport system ATP-binding protein
MIEVKNLKRYYKIGNVSVKALDNVNLTIEAGRIHCLMGKSGAGKSTLLHQIGLLDSPTSGEIEIEGRKVSNLNDKEKSILRLKKIGYVFQEYALLPELTAVENVFLPGLMSGQKKSEEKAYQLLNIVGLKSRSDHLPKELSGGEQQRVAIARSMINSPKYILADEPTANLDSISAHTVMDTFVKLNKDFGITIVFVSHDPDDKVYAEKLIFLKDGKIVKPYL